jgi:ABC-type sugar transport system permease subunit
MKKRINKKLINLLYVIPLITIIAVFIIIPSFQIFYYSLFKKMMDGSLIYVGLKNFVKVITSNNFFEITKNTFIWLITTVLLKNILGLALALLMCKKIKGGKILSFTALISWATPWIISALIFKWIFDGLYGYFNGFLFLLNIIDQPIDWLGNPGFAIWGPIIANVWTAIAFCGFTYQSVIYSIPKYLYEAAEIDGATRFQMFYNITFPQLVPTIKLLVLLTSLWGINSFDMIYTMTGGGPLYASETLVTNIYRLGFMLHEKGEASAVSVITFSLMMIFSIIYIYNSRKGEEYV